MPFAEELEEVLGVALEHVVEHLVASDDAFAHELDGVLEIARVEVRDAPRADFAVLLQRLEGAERLGKRLRSAPVEEIEIDAIGAEPSQAFLAREERPRVRRVVRMNLRREERLGAVAGDRLAHDVLHGSAPVDLGSVDVIHAAIDRAPNREDRFFAIAQLHLPCAQPDDGHLLVERSEGSRLHGSRPGGERRPRPVTRILRIDLRALEARQDEIVERCLDELDALASREDAVLGVFLSREGRALVEQIAQLRAEETR